MEKEITLADARQLVQEQLDKWNLRYSYTGDEKRFISHVDTRKHGWIIYFDALGGLIGNAPFFVSKQGRLETLYYTPGIEIHLKQWELKNGKVCNEKFLSDNEEPNVIFAVNSLLRPAILEQVAEVTLEPQSNGHCSYFRKGEVWEPRCLFFLGTLMIWRLKIMADVEPEEALNTKISHSGRFVIKHEEDFYDVSLHTTPTDAGERATLIITYKPKS